MCFVNFMVMGIVTFIQLRSSIKSVLCVQAFIVYTTTNALLVYDL